MICETYDEAEREARSMARVELGRCRLFKRVEGTRYHSGKSDWQLFFRNRSCWAQTIFIYNEPEGYRLVYGPKYSMC